MITRNLIRRPAILPLAMAALLAAGAAPAQQLMQGAALVQALRNGGYVILMRHASSPREAPDKDHANADNTKAERQLDDQGRATATAMGKALRDLKIPIGPVLASPTYRALETIQYAQLGKPTTVPELGESDPKMQTATEAQNAWLQKRVTQFAKGTNTVIVTHLPNITRPFPQWSQGLADGEALILGPYGRGGAALVARVKIEEWPKMVH